MQLISKLKSKDTKGHILILNNLLKAIKYEIVKTLTFNINHSLKIETFRDRLKVARVRPLFKKGDNQLITNYRPITILPSLSKIFEKVMHMQLTYYLESNTLMATTQYGYRSGHSTELTSPELVFMGILKITIFLVQYFAIFLKHLIAVHIQYYLII